MADLSPAAKAVRDAALATYDKSIPKDDSLWALDRASVVAALRAAAEGTMRKPGHWNGSTPDDYDCGWNDGVRSLLTIAAELEGGNG